MIGEDEVEVEEEDNEEHEREKKNLFVEYVDGDHTLSLWSRKQWVDRRNRTGRKKGGRRRKE
jgi:hypothetical protein